MANSTMKTPHLDIDHSGFNEMAIDATINGNDSSMEFVCKNGTGANQSIRLIATKNGLYLQKWNGTGWDGIKTWT